MADFLVIEVITQDLVFVIVQSTSSKLRTKEKLNDFSFVHIMYVCIYTLLVWCSLRVIKIFKLYCC